MAKQNKKKKNTKIIWPLLFLIAIFLIFFYLLPSLTAKSFDLEVKRAQENLGQFVSDIQEAEAPKKEEPKIKYIKTPEATKTIYMTACVASTVDFKQDLVDLIEETEINSIIIDIKDYTGTISFDTGENLEGENGTGCRAPNLKEFIKELKEKDIYVIGRVTVFQDPFYSERHPELAVKKASNGQVWSDHKGLHFIDVGAKPYWDYILQLTKLAHKAGFDEINFDYIRFPSDGNMKDIYFEHSNDVLVANGELGKQIALENFFKYLKTEIDKYNSELSDEAQPLVTSADLFGMVTTNYDDLNIGQVLERALPYFDYIAPMVYPSHYQNGFNGWSNPNNVPYELIHFVMQSAVKRVEDLKNATTTPAEVREHLTTNQLRPWIQDFDYGGDYGPAEVRAQIKAIYDVGLDSWMLWAPSNRYTRAALKDAE